MVAKVALSGYQATWGCVPGNWDTAAAGATCCRGAASVYRDDFRDAPICRIFAPRRANRIPSPSSGEAVTAGGPSPPRTSQENPAEAGGPRTTNPRNEFGARRVRRGQSDIPDIHIGRGTAQKLTIRTVAAPTLPALLPAATE